MREINSSSDREALLNRLAKTYLPHNTDQVGSLIRHALPFNNSEFYMYIHRTEPKIVVVEEEGIEVIAFKAGEILYIFVSSTIILGDTGVIEGEPVFEEIDKKDLYKRSCRVVEKFLKEELAEGSHIFLGGWNLLWLPVIERTLEINYLSHCVKYVITRTKVREEIKIIETLPPLESLDLYEDVLRDSDIETVFSHNKVKHDREYLLDAFSISTCIRDQTGSPISWCATHMSLSFSCLHTLPAHRRTGHSLARRVLCSVAQKHFKFLEKTLPGLDEYFLHADVENCNENAMRVFEKCGWTKLYRNTWVRGKRI